jgi:acyl-coenzyme A thioesterase PaaI-like protein
MTGVVDPGIQRRERGKMSPTIAEQQACLEVTRKGVHPDCVSCSATSPVGLGLKFVVREDGGVESGFACREIYQGYPGLLHGGVTSMLLDAAMTNCLFSRGKVAVTARLIVRFRLPIRVDDTAVIRAWLRDYSPPLFVLEAELMQNGRVMASAAGKFIDRDGL